MAIKEFCYLIYTKARLNVKAENSLNKLSYAWLLIEPLLFMGVYYIVFGILLHSKTDNFVIYLLTGLVPWLWFNKSINRSSMSIVAGKPISSQVPISKSFFVLVSCTQEFIRQTIAIAMLLITVVGFGYLPNKSWLWLPIVILLQFIFTIGCSLLLAFIVTYIRDVHLMLSSCTRILMYVSGIIYPISKVPETYQWVFDINPIANMIILYRQILIEQVSPSTYSLIYLLISAVSLIALSIALYISKDQSMTREVMR
ncbi:lipopolysaccharide transport system permease protein [Sinobacterium caligoides]|uniref:Transport permease protein n=1 Tax=Sinobacterium caligoides TaxID=933926 RepID=A0A3N2DPV7_9GAMM|nr:lipopolysaccharide transport system permease protein [Sinobacterium caligoides]